MILIDGWKSLAESHYLAAVYFYSRPKKRIHLKVFTLICLGILFNS